jgi:protein-S-isoprenylcysteine O-methyltransferase Ste14
MTVVYRYAFPAMWLSWAVYWWVASRDVKSTRRRESLPSRLSHIVPLTIAVFLLSIRRVPIAFLGERFLPLAEWPFWLGSLLTAGGLLFTVWARLHLGRNWSGAVTIKDGHELVTSGPYALVRHPIYTGLLLAFLGSAVALGDWRGALAFALAAGALWRKLRLEERWMREQFGDAYQAYSQRVAALVPFVL